MRFREHINESSVNYKENKWNTDLSSKLKKLINDALSEGYQFKWNMANEEDRTAFSLFKMNRKTKRITRGAEVFIGPKGTFAEAIRIDVDLTIATKIRTIKDVREVLRLE